MDGRRRSPAHLARIAIAALVGACGAAALLADGFVADAVAARRSARALAVAPGDAETLRLAAETALIAGDRAAAAAFARRALRRAPLDWRAMRTLGLALQRGDEGSYPPATRWFNLGAQLSWRDTATQVWMLRAAIRQQDFQAVVQRGDSLLRREQATERLIGLFDQLILAPAARAELADRLADLPTWRKAFLAALTVGSSEHAGDAIALLDAMTRTPAPPRPREIGPFLDRLVSAGYGDAAYRTWTRFEPAAAPRGGNLVVDGDFTNAGEHDGEDYTRAPFLWHVTQADAGAQIDSGPAPDGSQALLVGADGAGAAEIVRQLTVLTPGRYRASFRATSDDPAATARVRLGITCLAGAPELAAITPTAAPGWSQGAGTFVVPTGCSAQKLAFAILPADVPTTVQLAIRDVRVVRAMIAAR